ncbi:uncharacterized protein LOC128852898 [Cuculus canorus]|uniref:uncharacterized protein LOC128852898 n=1 Tax=Cuculus canorus TaxID=55661 RepID=UPI0023AA5A95|nr:uncharacterized protein LOC128852898 [Cuculus canorus]
MLRCGNKDLGSSSSAFRNRGAACISTLAVSRLSVMEGPDLLENGNIPQKRKFPCFQVALVFILITISALVPVVFCLFHLKQAPGPCWAHGFLKKPSHSEVPMLWEWNLEHCDGVVQKDDDQYLTIKKSGNYFIYAQVHHVKSMEASFAVELYKMPNISLNKAVGSNMGDVKGSINFGRPIFLQEGDKLGCRVNNKYLDSLEPGDQTYWGLYKI